jgi:hypothetical protein
MARKPRTPKTPGSQPGFIEGSTPTDERIGFIGLQQTGGWLQEEQQPELRGLRGMRVYRNIADNSTTVGALLFAVQMLLRNATWTVQARDETVEGQKAKELLEGMLDDMATTWPDVVDEIVTMFVYGFAPLEIIWKQRRGEKIGSDARLKTSKFNDGYLAPAALELRSQLTLNRWLFNAETEELEGLEQMPPGRGMIEIPRERLALFRTTKVLNNPEGRSLLRTSWRAYNIVTKMENVEAIGVERDLAGYPIIFLPPEYFEATASAAQKAELQSYRKLVTLIRRDQSEGMVLPAKYDRHGNRTHEIVLLGTGSSRQMQTGPIIERWHRYIATAALADFLFLGQQAVGSFALSSDKTALFAAAIGGFGKSITDTFNTEVVRKIWAYNGFDADIMPSLKFGDLETADMASIAALLTAMAGAGAPLFPDRELENHIRRLAGLPEAPEDAGDMADQPGQGPQPADPAVDQLDQ